MGKRAVALILSCVASFLFLELLLRILLPIHSFAVGTTNVSTVPNAAIYGWGYAPGSEIKQRNPDTEEIFSSRANSDGWKDVEHQRKKRNGSVRILILGDSNTLGIVPLKYTYPRVLEGLLRDAGFDAEVISVGYGGWGTDQALVALKRTGLSYEPDIVISQFDTNDLVDNLALNDIAIQKPFRFQVVNGELKMQPVQPKKISDERFSSRLKTLLLRSYVIFYANVVRLALEEHIPQPRRKEKGQNQTNTIGHDPRGPYFVHHLSQRGAPGIEAAWLLYEKLVGEMKRVSEQNRAIFLLFNAVEKGELAWAKRRRQIVEDETGHDAIPWEGKLHAIYYYRHVDRMKGVADRIGAFMIPNERSYTRYNNDAHANIEGNQRMAEDILDFLTTNQQTSRVLRKAQKRNEGE